MVLKNTIFYALLMGPVLFPGPLAADALRPLDRSLQSIRLGMTPEAFGEAVPSVEMEQMYLNLLPGERFLKVKEDVLADGIAQFTGRFYLEQLYKITVEYNENWMDDEAWRDLLQEKMEQHGKVPVEEMPVREGIFQSARWEDDATIYILRRQVRLRFKDKKLVNQTTVFVTYLDKTLWAARSRAETEGLF
jgi:hypothetical protein